VYICSSVLKQSVDMVLPTADTQHRYFTSLLMARDFRHRYQEVGGDGAPAGAQRNYFFATQLLSRCLYKYIYIYTYVYIYIYIYKDHIIHI
jgi:hypothetical protein